MKESLNNNLLNESVSIANICYSCCHLLFPSLWQTSFVDYKFIPQCEAADGPCLYLVYLSCLAHEVKPTCETFKAPHLGLIQGAEESFRPRWAGPPV